MFKYLKFFYIIIFISIHTPSLSEFLDEDELEFNEDLKELGKKDSDIFFCDSNMDEATLSIKLKNIESTILLNKLKLEDYQKELDEKQSEINSLYDELEKKKNLLEFYKNLSEERREDLILAQESTNEKNLSNANEVEKNNELKFGDTGYVLSSGKKWTIPDFSMEFYEDHRKKKIIVYAYLSYFVEANYGKLDYVFLLSVNEGKECMFGVCKSNDNWEIYIQSRDPMISLSEAKKKSKFWKKKLNQINDLKALVKITGISEFQVVDPAGPVTMIVDAIDIVDFEPDD
tara:strand:- start:127 stop:990 length:864 start_codon:yes stop_codon:yes gene_type:complete